MSITSDHVEGKRQRPVDPIYWLSFIRSSSFLVLDGAMKLKTCPRQCLVNMTDHQIHGMHFEIESYSLIPVRYKLQILPNKSEWLRSFPEERAPGGLKFGVKETLHDRPF